MRHQEYGHIIIVGLCDSPKFLVNHFRREADKIKKERGYGIEEIENDFRETLEIFRNRIHQIHKVKTKELKPIKRVKIKDPALELNSIFIDEVEYPDKTKHNISGLTRSISLSDLKEVEKSLDIVFGTNSDANIKIKKIPETFADLFIDKNMISKCLDVLREVKPPLIDLNNKFLGGVKGSFCIWVYELKNHGFIYSRSDTIYAQLLPTIINGLTIETSMFRKSLSGNKAERLYKNDFIAMLCKLKSQ